MKVRLEGTLQECQQAAPRLPELFEVVSVSDPYPNRGRSGWSASTWRSALADQHQADQDGATPWRVRATIRQAGRELPPP